jgi:hypothetical protein
MQDARVEEYGALVLDNRWMFNRLAGGDTSVYHGPLFGLEMSSSPFSFMEIFAEGKSWRAMDALRFWEIHKTLPTLMFNYGQNLEVDGCQFAGAGIKPVTSNELTCFFRARPGLSASRLRRTATSPRNAWPTSKTAAFPSSTLGWPHST